LWHIFENGWEDKDYIAARVWALDDVREEVKKWDPALVEDVTGAKEREVFEVARIMAENRPGTLVWCMGGTQHHIGNNNTRAYRIFQLALGNIGVPGGGANIFRGHDNVQSATDVGPNSHTLPGYYGLSESAWRHWARVWDVEYEWLVNRFDRSRKYLTQDGKEKYTMNIPGIPVSRWIDGVLLDAEDLQQKSPFRAVFFQGHACNSQTRGPDMKEALEKLEMVVISDPYPTHMAVMSERKEGIYLLPTCTQMETYGSVTASNRSLQWREKVMEPRFESLPDHVVLYKFAKRFGFADRMFKHIRVNGDEPLIEDVLREINRGAWTIGYTGQSPERLKAHAKYRHHFDTTTLQAKGGPLDGEYYGLPWPCWAPPEMKHPGTPILYDMSKPVAEGGRIKVKAMVTERVPPGVVWTPFHFGGWYQGKDLKHRYPDGTAPFVRGEACNTATTYGYDSVTQMQETKSTLCRLVPA
jgi:formate dehydrogenase major subunit